VRRPDRSGRRDAAHGRTDEALDAMDSHAGDAKRLR
jgi:hypothetical protein